MDNQEHDFINEGLLNYGGKYKHFKVAIKDDIGLFGAKFVKGVIETFSGSTKILMLLAYQEARKELGL